MAPPVMQMRRLACTIEPAPQPLAGAADELHNSLTHASADACAAVCRVVSMIQEDDTSRQAPQFSMSEVEQFRTFARTPNVQQKVFDMIAPQIFGSEQIKEAIACLLFGGSRKVRLFLSCPRETRHCGGLFIAVVRPCTREHES